MASPLDWLFPSRSHPGDCKQCAQLLAAIEALRDQLTQLETRIMSALTDLQAEVAADDTVMASAITLLNGLKAALDAAIASGDPAALTALSADLAKNRQALADAVTANTPAAPATGG